MGNRGSLAGCRRPDQRFLNRLSLLQHADKGRQHAVAGTNRTDGPQPRMFYPVTLMRCVELRAVSAIGKQNVGDSLSLKLPDQHILLFPPAFRKQTVKLLHVRLNQLRLQAGDQGSGNPGYIQNQKCSCLMAQLRRTDQKGFTDLTGQTAGD